MPEDPAMIILLALHTLDYRVKYSTANVWTMISFDGAKGYGGRMSAMTMTMGRNSACVQKRFTA